MNRKKGERHYKGFKQGDKVWLEGTNLHLSHPTAKLAPKRYGPFTITHIISPVVYRLELPGHWKIHNIFHSSLLTPYCETTEHGENFTQPPPELVEGKEEYVVDRIMNSQRHGRNKKLQFLIRWEGYSPVHDSWEDAADVHAPKKLEEYYQCKRAAVQTLKYKEDTSCSTISSPNSSSTPLLSLDAGLPLRIASTHLMQYNEQPVDPTTALPTSAEVPQGQLASYNHNNIWLYTGAAFTLDERMNDHK